MNTLLSPHLPTFIFVAINLGILYWALKKILFKPVTEFMENRTASIEKAIADANQKNVDADELINQYEQKLLAAKEEADNIIKEARSRAEREYTTILNNARADSENLTVKAREQIEREREQMRKEVRNEVASLALSAASKIIEANMDNEKNRVLVNKFIDEAGAA